MSKYSYNEKAETWAFYESQYLKIYKQHWILGHCIINSIPDDCKHLTSVWGPYFKSIVQMTSIAWLDTVFILGKLIISKMTLFKIANCIRKMKL